jgi:hypothetical protein
MNSREACWLSPSILKIHQILFADRLQLFAIVAWIAQIHKVNHSSIGSSNPMPRDNLFDFSPICSRPPRHIDQMAPCNHRTILGHCVSSHEYRRMTLA